MAKPMVLRCQFKGGQRKTVSGLTNSSTISELQETLFLLTDVPPHRQRVMNGFPPKQLDLDNKAIVLSDTTIRSGDTLIVEENKEEPKILQEPKNNVALPATPKLVRKVVPADNSCLFASISFVMLQDVSFADDIRKLAATCISKNSDIYNEAILGKSNHEYCLWLTNKEHWGGAIELNVLSLHYEVEINVADIQSGRIDRFGEDALYQTRVFLLYDGIHYDPMGLEKDGSIIQTIFPVNNHNVQIEALNVASKCKEERQYTDLSGFALRCLICNTPLKGQSQAQGHAKQTGHMNFGEV